MKTGNVFQSNNLPIYLEGSDTGILLIHGLTAGPFEMSFLGHELSRKGYTISIPLLPGHGGIPSDLISCTWRDWFSHAKQSLFELRKRCKTVFIIGQSMGGTLALHLAAHFQVEGVVGLATGMKLKEKKAVFLPFAAPFKRYRIKKDGPDIRDEKAKQDMTVHSYDRTSLKAAVELKKMFKHVAQDLSEIYAPLLLIHSINDHVTDFRGSEYIYKRVASEHKHLLKLTESFHVLSVDVEKHIVYREINKFVKQIINTSSD